MRTLEEIYAIASERHGGDKEVEAKLPKPKSNKELTATPDDRWLAGMSKAIFQGGFNWKVVENKWPGTEEAFEGFDIDANVNMTPERFDALTQDKRIIRNPAKIASVQQNATFIRNVSEEHGSFGKFVATWPTDDYVGLLEVLQKQGSRLGSQTGQIFLRFAGVDSFVLSKDVVARLVAEGVIDKAPTGKKHRQAVQEAFNAWREESGRSLTEVSRILALSI